MLEFIKYEDIDQKILGNTDNDYISMVAMEQLIDMCDMLGLSSGHVSNICDEDGCRFESYDGFDFLSIQILDANKPQEEKPHICVYLRENLLIFAGSSGEHLSSAVEQIKESRMDIMGVDDILYRVMDVIIADDFDALEAMEDRIGRVEEQVITGKNKNCMHQVMRFRRDLSEMKRFYQQMYMVCEQILENDNGIIKDGTIRYFKMLRSRMDRLLSTVLSLRDFVTQVREAYQAQVDISQNNIMKFFTVVTSIFMPLTLIAGWYGMNLRMPEYGWEYGYLFVIIVSAVIVSALIINFKRRNWF